MRIPENGPVVILPSRSMASISMFAAGPRPMA
jgi:hypothetical protein